MLFLSCLYKPCLFVFLMYSPFLFLVYSRPFLFRYPSETEVLRTRRGWMTRGRSCSPAPRHSEPGASESSRRREKGRTKEGKDNIQNTRTTCFACCFSSKIAKALFFSFPLVFCHSSLSFLFLGAFIFIYACGQRVSADQTRAAEPRW